VNVESISYILFDNLPWMSWDLFLALTPLLLSLFIFNRRLWLSSFFVRLLLVTGVVIYFLFLPNAPYVLSKIERLVVQIMNYRFYQLSRNQIVTLLIPQYSIYIFLGFSFYVLAFQRFIHFLVEFNWRIVWIWVIKLLNPLLMSTGILLGMRYHFNTWELINRSDDILFTTLNEFSRFDSILLLIYISMILFAGFEILSIFYKSLFKNLFASPATLPPLNIDQQ
jgi:uncharacterized membrane protein